MEKGTSFSIPHYRFGFSSIVRYMMSFNEWVDEVLGREEDGGGREGRVI